MLLDLRLLRLNALTAMFRGQGVGRVLTETCICRARRRARRAGAPLIALHISRIMEVAQARYRRLGLEFAATAPAIQHGISIKKLEWQ